MFSFFKGWYFKHSFKAKNLIYTFIPGIAIDANGNKVAFLQVITKDKCYYKQFSDIFYCEKSFSISIGNSVFTRNFSKINIEDTDLSLNATFKYGSFTPVKASIYAPNIMGPFAYLKFLECNHNVISVNHKVDGEILHNGKAISLSEGKGYIEMDWGKTFPKNWFWIQCNDFDNLNGFFKDETNAMLAFADVPFLKGRFNGVLGVFTIEGKQIVVASYYGAKVQILSKSNNSIRVLVLQGKYKIFIDAIKTNGLTLKAPVLGEMTRNIKESVNASLYLKVIYGSKVIYENVGENAGFEIIY